jgi:Fe-S cluster assembly scaffold protein SufB
MSELEAFFQTLDRAGADRSILADQGIAHLVASGSRILSARSVDGLIMDAVETAEGIKADVKVADGVTIPQPIHLCFGILHTKGLQRIIMSVSLGKGARAHFMAHCIFPNAEAVTHVMEATAEIGEGAEMHYSEAHFHGYSGGIDVRPKASVKVGRRGQYISDFSLTTGRVGSLSIDYDVEAGEEAIAELTARVFGHASDKISIKERVILAETGARGLIKTRVALEDDASAEVTNITEGNAAGARGHVDCLELVKDRAVAKAIPVVNVSHPLAKVTHEAAIGTVDQKQLETLMAHGLAPEEAVDIIVRGVLR